MVEGEEQYRLRAEVVEERYRLLGEVGEERCHLPVGVVQAPMEQVLTELVAEQVQSSNPKLTSYPTTWPLVDRASH